uniref:Uncharacterized protein n=1 Tax=Megaselia scalaris TaxID=36166 RepID=T1GSA8_MEGSC
MHQLQRPTYIIRFIIPPLIDMVSELGIFGVVIGAGHMLRSKISKPNEDGVTIGICELWTVPI